MSGPVRFTIDEFGIAKLMAKLVIDEGDTADVILRLALTLRTVFDGGVKAGLERAKEEYSALHPGYADFLRVADELIASLEKDRGDIQIKGGA